jgi:peptidoglycan/LPS O-acetylase OafA/YrhL
VITSFFLFSLATFGVGLITGPLWLVPIVIWGVAAVLSLISGIGGLSKPASHGTALGSSVTLMICIIFCDLISFGLGLVSLILLLSSEVKAFYGKA